MCRPGPGPRQAGPRQAGPRQAGSRQAGPRQAAVPRRVVAALVGLAWTLLTVTPAYAAIPGRQHDRDRWPPAITAPADGSTVGVRPTFQGTGPDGAAIAVHDETWSLICLAEAD